MKLDIQIEISPEQIEGLLTTAFEGGSNYWYLVEGFNKAFRKDEPKDMYWWDCMRNRIEDGTFELKVYDLETSHAGDLDLLGCVTNESIEKAITLMAKDYPKHFNDWMNDNYDGDTADVFLQLCVMGDVVFG